MERFSGLLVPNVTPLTLENTQKGLASPPGLEMGVAARGLA